MTEKHQFLDLPKWASPSHIYTLLLFGFIGLSTLSYYVSKAPFFSGNLPFFLALVTFAITFLSPYTGLGVLTLFLSFSPAFVEQLNAIIGTEYIRFSIPGFDIALGFILAMFARHSSVVSDGIQKIPPLLVIALATWIGLSAFVSCLRNIWQSASPYSVRGLLYNLSQARDLNWHYDYFPLADFQVYSLCFLILFPIAGLTKKDNGKTLQSLFWGVFAGCLANFSLSVMQKWLNIGWARDGIQLGLNGFWPDLHAFSGFMTFCLFFGLHFLVKAQVALYQRLAALTLVIMAAACIFWSQSRFAILMTIIVTLVYFARFQLFESRAKKLAGLFLVSLLTIGCYLVLKSGIRGFTFESIQSVYQDYSFEHFNTVFSYRPEVFLSALSMYEAFPWFGLGQGSFNHLSSIQGFSTSPYLLNSGGENAHNYLLQTFTELGPIGFAGFFALIITALGRPTGKARSFMKHALGGILISNIFAHSLLVREMLILTFLIIGFGFGASSSSSILTRIRYQPKLIKYACAAACILLFSVSSYEVVASFNKFPFTYGRSCYSAEPLTQDGWAKGLYELPVTDDAKSIRFSIIPGHPDVERRPLKIEISGSEKGKSALIQSLSVQTHDSIPIEISSSQLAGKDRISIRTSRCYVPLNLGVVFDPRPLGFQLKDLQISKRLSPSMNSLN